MEKSTIIRLRQNEAADVSSNGAFSVSLKEGITLEEGDEVRVHSVILDTSQESVINIEKDTRVTMGVVKYFRNYIATRPTVQTINPAGTPNPDLKLYYSSLRSSTTGTNFLLQAIYMQATVSGAFGVGLFGGAETIWEYYDPTSGKKTQRHVTLPQFSIEEYKYNSVFVTPAGKEGSRTNGLITGSVAGAKYFKLISPSPQVLAKAPYFCKVLDKEYEIPAGQAAPKVQDLPGLGWGNDGSAVSTTPDTITLNEEICEFDIKAAAYSPAEIAQIVNDNMTELASLGPIGNTINVSYPVNNPFLGTVNQMHKKVSEIVNPDGSSPTLVFSPAATSETPGPGQNIITLANPASVAADALIGANAVSMNFDENLKKMNFDSLHMPFYISPTPAAPASTTFVPGVGYPAGGLPQEPQISYGGVSFTRLVSFETVTTPDGTIKVTDKPTNFWRQLGFENLTVNHGHGITPLTLDGGSTIFPLEIDTTLGGNVTGALVTIDQVVNKSAPGNVPFPITPFVGDSENNFTVPILSARTFDSTDNDEGYYMIDVGVKMPQKMIGGFAADGLQTTSNSIQAIVGKYFTSGNFLQSQGSGEVVYTHRGETQMIRDLNVRVLHPDFSVPDNTELGDRNSIFLEVIKTVDATAPSRK